MRPRAECTVQAPVAPRRFSISYSSFSFSFGPQPVFLFTPQKQKGAGRPITQASQPLSRKACFCGLQHHPTRRPANRGTLRLYTAKLLGRYNGLAVDLFAPLLHFRARVIR